MLVAREERAKLRKMIAVTDRSSVSLSLNVPGFPKSNEVARLFFEICMHDLKHFLKVSMVGICDKDEKILANSAGDFYIVPVSSSQYSAIEVKSLCEHFEEEHPLGRFIDVDITDRNGSPVSSGKSKLCFYCGKRPAIECRRENMHETEELRSFMFARMENHCRMRKVKDISNKLASLAVKAIIAEVSLTPKPGLVDKLSTGSHDDMNYRTFLDSTQAISPWFSQLVQEGIRFKEDDLAKALPVLRAIGLKMETAMYAATHNVNTQKGLVFLLGLSLFSCGYLFASHNKYEPDQFRDIIRQICRSMTARELENSSSPGETHGEQVYHKYRVPGARGEAEMGFPTVFDYGLPVLQSCKEMNDEALIRTFLSIAAHNNDTNILYRSNMEMLNRFKELAMAAYKNFTPENYNILMQYCRNEKISPGGSADLLVITIFIYSLMHAEIPGFFKTKP